MGSIPAEALPFLFFYAFHLFSFSFVVWSRGAMETRLPPKQKIVGSTPTGIVFSLHFYSSYRLTLLCSSLSPTYFPFSLFRFSYTHSFLTYMSLTALPSLSPPLSLSLPPLIGSFSLFPSLSCKQGWPSGPRRQFKVLFSSEAWVRTPPLAF